MRSWRGWSWDDGNFGGSGLEPLEGLDSFGDVALDPVFTDGGLTLQARTITLEGTDTDERLDGHTGNDVITGRDGDDTLSGFAGDDLLLGGGGDDVIAGGEGSDRLIGGAGSDTADYSFSLGPVHADLGRGTVADGLGGEDTLISIENLLGSDYADIIIGSGVDNVIVGGAGADILTGGAGRDTFTLTSVADAGDVITDFTSGEDAIELDARAFGFDATRQPDAYFSIVDGPYNGTGAGANAAFAAGQSALVFSAADSILYFDPNGAEEGYTVLATLQGGAHLAANDIRLIDSLSA